jgi:hypothetical protein
MEHYVMLVGLCGAATSNGLKKGGLVFEGDSVSSKKKILNYHSNFLIKYY